ncbi:MAG: MATE family efflux transporter [Armatimonadaceae bacterium]
MILEGNVHRAVLAVAFPSVATMLLQTTNSQLDFFFVGQLGPDALAAVTVSSSLMFALISAVTAISAGTTALVARFVGEGNEEDGVVAVRQSLLLAVLLSLLVGLPMLFFRDGILSVLGLQGNALSLASRYLFITVLGMPALFLMWILNGAFRGLGDTVRPFWITLIANIIHAIGNWLLIFGNLGFPRMGLAGGALALAISQVVATVLFLILLRYSAVSEVYDGPWTLRMDWARRITRIGIPAAFQQLIRTGSFLAFQSLLAKTAVNPSLGAAAIAALGVGLRAESIAFMPGFGYSIAASAFVGQNLGAKQPDRASAGAWSATFQAVAIMTFMGILFAVFAEPFAGIFIKHMPGESAAQAAQVDQTLALTVAYLHIALWSEPFLALGMVLTGALQGAGETVGPTRITLMTMLVMRLSLGAYVLFLTPWGIPGAWWTMTLSTIAGGIATVLLFIQGRWRDIQV